VLLALRPLPLAVGDDDNWVATFKLNDEFAQQASGSAFVGDGDCQHIDARTQVRCYISHLWALPSKFLSVATGDFRSVNEKHELVVSGHQDAGAGDFAVRWERKSAAEVANSSRRLLAGLPFRRPNPSATCKVKQSLLPRGRLIIANPFALPIGRFQQSHRPTSRFAPLRRVAVFVPDPNFPPAFHFGPQRLARVNDERLVGVHFARVPKVTDIFVKVFAGRGDEDLVSGLALPSLVWVCRFHDPTSRGWGTSMPNGLTRYSHLKLVTLNPAIAIPPVISVNSIATHRTTITSPIRFGQKCSAIK
jgi:hypothetical protein